MNMGHWSPIPLPFVQEKGLSLRHWLQGKQAEAKISKIAFPMHKKASIFCLLLLTLNRERRATKRQIRNRYLPQSGWHD